MSRRVLPSGFDRYATIGDLALRTRRVLARWLGWLTVLLTVETSYLLFTGKPGAGCFGLIAAGAVIILATWQVNGRGLPVAPMMAIQTLVAYGLPIAVGHPVVKAYPADLVLKAGGEVLVFSAVMTALWWAVLHVLTPRRAVSHAFESYQRTSASKISRLAFCLVVGATAYQVLDSIGALGLLMALLPSGANSIFVALVSAVSTCGFFLLAMLAGGGDLRPAGRAILWCALAINGFIAASSFLLSSVMITVIAVAIGLFWGNGRIPWRYLAVVLSILAFLNVGKYSMRIRYWDPEEQANAIPSFSLAAMPGIYSEWVQASLDDIATSSKAKSPAAGFDRAEGTEPDEHSLLDRINNLQNLLYVMQAEGSGHIAPLGGATYSIIPSLLVPRILWPDKPRTHEGQVLLNVHFGRQDLHATFETYIAWGLLPEAYGNFGPFWGAAVLGAVLGALFAWIENFTARKLVISMEGFVSFAFFLGVANSFEMVASVAVTSIFQAMIPIIIAAAPFVHRLSPREPSAGEPPSSPPP